MTSDNKLFITDKFIRQHLNGQIKIFTDISYEEIANTFQIPVNYIEEIGNHLKGILTPELVILKEKITSILRTNDKVDLKPFASELTLHIEDLIDLISDDDRIVVWKHFCVSQKWVAPLFSKLLVPTVVEGGKITNNLIQEKLQVTGFTISDFYRSIILEKGVRGILTSDKKLFLTNEFIKKHLEEKSRIFTDISYEEIANTFQIPTNYVEEILAEALKENIIAGRIDRSSRRLQTQEKVAQISEIKIKGEFTAESVFLIQKLMEKFSCSELQVIRSIKEDFRDRSLFVTRIRDIVRIEALKFVCQICKTEGQDNKFFECNLCKQHVCWDHFIELSRVARPVCPNCDGELVLLPKYCEKCLTDYLTIPSKSDYCEFCGYNLSYVREVDKFAKEAQREVIANKGSSQGGTFDTNKE